MNRTPPRNLTRLKLEFSLILKMNNPTQIATAENALDKYRQLNRNQLQSYSLTVFPRCLCYSLAIITQLLN